MFLFMGRFLVALLFGLAVGLGATCVPASAQAAFFSLIDDVPMPPGFSERAAPAVFDGGRGRLIIGFAQGQGAPLAVRDFYIETLPQLGWTVAGEVGGLMFRRGREKLSLAIVSGAQGELLVDAVLTAERASQALD
jgi:hypothetical protein